MKARVRLYWNPSVSVDVTSQVLNLNVNAVELDPVVLGPLVNEYEVVLNEKDSVTVVVVTSDGTFQVPSEALVFSLPDLSQPLPATQLGYEIVEVLPSEE